MRVIISVGGRFHAFNLAQQLVKHGHLESLITPYPKFEVQKYNIPLTHVKSVIAKEVLERSWRKLPVFVKKSYNPQYLISNLFDRQAAKRLSSADIFVGWSSFSLASLKRAKQMGMLTIVDHGSSHIQYQDKVVREEYEKHGASIELSHPKIIDKELEEYALADYVAIPSKFVKRSFLEYGFPEHKLIHVPYGVDLSQFKQIAKQDNKFRVVFVGGMTLRKGVHYLLQAFTELNLPNSELLLIGSFNSEMAPFFNKYGVRRDTDNRTNENRINFIGPVPQADLYKYYSQGSVFVMMSIEEGLAMVQPQAMACGLPVICTRNTGGDDIVRDEKDGFVIPIRDVATLKDKLQYLYENPDIRDEMGQSAKARVSSGFSWDDYGNSMCAEYERVLNK